MRLAVKMEAARQELLLPLQLIGVRLQALELPLPVAVVGSVVVGHGKVCGGDPSHTLCPCSFQNERFVRAYSSG